MSLRTRSCRRVVCGGRWARVLLRASVSFALLSLQRGVRRLSLRRRRSEQLRRWRWWKQRPRQQRWRQLLRCFWSRRPPPKADDASCAEGLRLLHQRGVRLRALAAAKLALRWLARVRARRALAFRLGLHLRLGVPKGPSDGAVDVDAERVRVHLVRELSGAPDCSARRTAQLPSRCRKIAAS